MNEGKVFIDNMLAVMLDQNLSEAELSLSAGLNRRAVTDLREGRVKSPKLSTVFAISKALNKDPGVMMGIGNRHKVRDDLAKYLSQYPEEQQQRLLAAMRVADSGDQE